MEDMEKARAKLKGAMLGQMPEPGSYLTEIEGVSIRRRDSVSAPESCLCVARIIMVVQGRKRTVVGGTEYLYGEDDIFVAEVDMPNTSTIMVASPKNPCLSICVDIDKTIIAQLALEMPDVAAPGDGVGCGLLIQSLDAGMLDAFVRLADLFDAPERIAVMAPLIIKEIHYRVLIGPHGDCLRMFYMNGTQRNQVTRAIAWLRDNFRQRFTVDELAEQVHMASSTFHRRFKETTRVSPLQFQKRLRLHEAQRLMLVEDFDAGSACEAVGYESLTQFNREYKRLFGEPPRRNITRWQREHAGEATILPGD